ncbi:MAG: hypothetical protein EAZ57_07555 [Cytophagales bacterium]|nr:MAG: hypothetical protein EAZ67_08640 [Cytophagales bacterium]TAF60393.1 MAG: hypothetical protein EAZ57_07555 [Cytophagales bacterium]
MLKAQKWTSAIAILIFALLLLPVLLQFDFYPFLKFSMFADNSQRQVATICLEYRLENEHKYQVFEPAYYQISPHFWTAWVLAAKTDTQKQILKQKIKQIIEQKRHQKVVGISWLPCEK